MQIKPEIMSPAGYFPQLHAAIEAGADAVYFGLRHFSARAKVGFELAELPSVMRTLHGRGVRGYLTFNTLVFDSELQQAQDTLQAVAQMGVDALIVQDVGIAQLCQQWVPDLPVHGSTQMSITSAEGVALAQRFGVRRVVLARELSLADVRQIRAASDCELEIFVHGALCVSYSGQCFSSEAWGGRSANRGQCAQACRLPYQLLVDGKLEPLADARYLLSPGDLYALQQVPEIVQMGIHSLKIEGRYKSADYVALTTQAYRQAVDAAWAGLPDPTTAETHLHLQQVYSRGLGAHFISGTNHQAVVNGRSPRHRGVLMGKVAQVLPHALWIVPENPQIQLKAGDGVVLDAADWRSPQEKEEGGRVFAVQERDGQWEVQFGNGQVDFSRVRVGDWLWRSHDPALEKVVRPFVQASTPLARQPLTVRVNAVVGQVLVTEWQLVRQPTVQVQVCSEQVLEPAANQPLNPHLVREQLARLGGTPYELEACVVESVGQPFVSVSLLNQLRRQAVTALQVVQTQLPERKSPTPYPLPTRPAQPSPALATHSPQPSSTHFGTALFSIGKNVQTPSVSKIHLLVRTPEQLTAALALAPASITLDYLELYGLRPAVEQIRAAGIAARVASPRILKPSEQRIVNFLRRLDCGVLVRSGGLLQAMLVLPDEQAMPALDGDFSLNAANLLTAQTFLQMGLGRITPTHDLNAAQVAELALGVGGERLEVVAYQHLPVFHMEHCVFCRFLSSGTSYLNCGHPCEQHRVALRDERGRAHAVMADVGCRNTVFGAEAQTASKHLKRWQSAGVRHFRLEFVHESAKQVRAISQAFALALAGQISAGELHQRLEKSAPGGTAEGSLYVESGM
ncbi:MAG TPA: DUF3656 domain-containing protein [Anaerolineales bacterium]|nr:DUF3656 domain-containing protein [Anaerolineales bacterium]